MARSGVRGPWPGGMNNLANWRALPAGTVRDSINVDPHEDGIMSLRAGYQRVYSGSDVRGALAIGEYVLIADGDQLRVFDVRTNATQTLRTIAPAGRFVGTVWNDELFFCTENETLRFRGGVLRSWGVTTVSSQPVPSVGPGSLTAGYYWSACTLVDAAGDEGGTTSPVLIALEANSSLVVQLPNPPAGGKVRFYVGSQDGETLYLQYESELGGEYVCSTVRDDGPRLVTQFTRAPVVADKVAYHNGVLLMVEGKTLWMTEPLRPHLRNASKRFFQYSSNIDMVISSEEDGGLFLSAGEATYFLTDIESSEPKQKQVAPYGAVGGTEVATPDNKVAWMTQYGLAKSTGQGKVGLLSAANFVPELAQAGGSGIVENNGSQLVVTTLSGIRAENNLAARDYYEAEIIYND